MPEQIRPSDVFPDPVLTQWVVSYGSGPGLVQDVIAPPVPVARPEFKYGVYKADHLNTDIETRVIPGEAPNQVRRAKPTYVPGSCIRNGLDDSLTDEVINQSPNPIVLERSRTLKLTHEMKLGVEKRLKVLLDNGGSAVTAPSVKFDASSGKIDIEGTFDAAREAFVKKCGFEANAALVQPWIAKVMKRDQTIRDLRRYTDGSLLTNGDLPDRLWNLRIIVPGALNNTGNPKADFSQTVDRIWNGKTIYLLYIEPNADTQTMNSIAQFRWAQYGQPYAAYRWRDSHQSKRVQWISVENYQTELVVCNDAILRIPDVLS